MKVAISVVLFASTAATAQPASAAVPLAPENNPSQTPDRFGHALQFGLSAGLVGGYNINFRYDSSPYCRTPETGRAPGDQQKFCGNAAPLSLNLALSFAPLDMIEPYVFGRFGLKAESESDTLPVRVLGAGARIYTMSDSAFKIFIDPALAYEFEGGAGTPTYQTNTPRYKQDLLFHLAAGPELDVARALGFFVDAGLTTGILRSIHSELEVQAGIQARFL